MRRLDNLDVLLLLSTHIHRKQSNIVRMLNEYFIEEVDEETLKLFSPSLFRTFFPILVDTFFNISLKVERYKRFEFSKTLYFQ